MTGFDRRRTLIELWEEWSRDIIHVPDHLTIADVRFAFVSGFIARLAEMDSDTYEVNEWLDEFWEIHEERAMNQKEGMR
jgi:hypothetical protein